MTSTPDARLFASPLCRHSGKFCARVGVWFSSWRRGRKIYPESRLVALVPDSFQETGFRIKNDFLREKSFLSGMTPVLAAREVNQGLRQSRPSLRRHSGKFCACVGGWFSSWRRGRKIYPESRLVALVPDSFQKTGFRIKNDFLREKSFLSGMTPVLAAREVNQGTRQSRPTLRRHSGKFCARVGVWFSSWRRGRKIYPESRLVALVPDSFQETGFRIKNDFLREKSFLSGMTLVLAAREVDQGTLQLRSTLRRHSGKFCACVGVWFSSWRRGRKIYPESRLVVLVPNSFQETGFRIKNDFLREKSFLSGMTPVLAARIFNKGSLHA